MSMQDLLYIGVALLFFLATWGLLRACELLDDHRSEDHT